MRKVVIGLSGGMDSTTLLGLVLSLGYEAHCALFYYGSKHNQYELKAAEEVMEYYSKEYPDRVHPHKIDISGAMTSFTSNLLASSEGAIPEGHYNDESMKKTVVPGRNLIFASIMAGLAESVGADAVLLGIHQGDHHIYPDCRTEFAKALDTTLYLSSDKRVELLTPFIKEDKASILQIGFDLIFQEPSVPVPYALTRTCYKAQPISCGKCGSCRERLEAFQEIGKPDPIQYEGER